MKAELISTGTELLLGQIVNTNAQFLSKELALLGIDVFYQVTVGDNLSRLVEVLRRAAERSDLVIVSGGLGPTEDDVTREALAEALNLSLREDAAVFQKLEEFFAGRGYPMPANNRKQALVPEGAIILGNLNGTAPGIIVEKDDKCFILLPGPPRELQDMFTQHVMPYLRKKTGAAPIQSKVLRICGIGESAMEERLGELMHSQNPTVAPQAKLGEVHLRITAKAPRDEGIRMIEEMEQQIRARLGDLIYGVNEETLEQVVGEKLIAKKMTLAVAESCTGGLLGHRITNVPGSSRYFVFGGVVYDNRFKEKLLGIDRQLLVDNGAVSPQVAEAMARGARRYAGTQVGVGITGIAGPGGGTPEKPVGLVYLAVDLNGKVSIRKEVFWGGREEIKQRSAQRALVMLYQQLTRE